MFVGEQPGDMEDRQGRPFVGPAGRILDKALAEARILREEVYVTNAVKHFKFIQRGKRRLHQKPLIRQVISCRPWLQAELEIIHPKVVVCLGATAAQSILSRIVHVTKERGKIPRRRRWSRRLYHDPSFSNLPVTRRKRATRGIPAFCGRHEIGTP